jgi:hypothetical protein
MSFFEMKVEGVFGVKFLGSNGRELDAQEQRLVYSGLKGGDFVASMNSKKIYDLSDLTSHIYKFEIVLSEDVEYEWDEVEN